MKYKCQLDEMTLRRKGLYGTYDCFVPKKSVNKRAYILRMNFYRNVESIEKHDTYRCTPTYTHTHKHIHISMTYMYIRLLKKMQKYFDKKDLFLLLSK